jgi:hypothetical protein
MKNLELKTYSNDEGNEHDAPILTVDYFMEKKLIITAGEDQKIKFWTKRKILLLQLLIEEGLYGVWVINGRGELIIGHEGKVI